MTATAIQTQTPAIEATVHLRRPHARQREFIDSKAKRKVIRAGRRGGKTVGIAIFAVQAFLTGHRVLYAAPTQEQVGAFWFEVRRALAEPIDSGLFAKNESIHRIEWPNTRAHIKAKTAWNADTLRGDFADLLILDEFQLMNEDAWGVVGAPMLMDNDGDAVFIYTPPSLRSAGVTKATDPRHASKLFKRALGDETGRWATFHFTSFENPYISKAALSEIAADVTHATYLREIMAEDDDDNPAALWKRANIDADRVVKAPEMARIVVAVDPSCTEAGDEAGIVTCGKGADGDYYLLGDDSLQASPDGWARAAVTAFHRWDADRVVYETNQGGEMVEQTLKTVDRSVPLKDVHASRGKLTRAEPVAALAEQHRVHHVGAFPQLEDELCSYTGERGQASPNRLDAYVYALTELHTRPGMASGMTRGGIGL